MDQILATFHQLIELQGVAGVYALTPDGFLTESLHAAKVDPEGVAAESAVVHMTSYRVGQDLSLGNLKWIVLEYKKGKIIIAPRGEYVWTVIADKNVAFGNLIRVLGAGQQENAPHHEQPATDTEE